MTSGEILTIPEVAALLRIAEKTVYTLAQRGKLPAFKVGGKWRFSRIAILSWIEQQTRFGRQGIGGTASSPPVGSRGRPRPGSEPAEVAEAAVSAWDLSLMGKRRPEHMGDKREKNDVTTEMDSAGRLGCDAGAYSTRNSSKGSLIAQTHAVFRALATGKSVSEVRTACLTGTLLRQSARETRHRIWEALHWRFFAWYPPAWVLEDLAQASRADATSARFIGLVFVHYARRDRLTFDFVTDWLWTRWNHKSFEVRRDDVLDFLADCDARDGGVKKWRESTRKKVAGNVLSALRDFGLLVGVQRKSLQRQAVAPEVTLHLCRLLDGEGLRGRALVEARDWRLFLWEPHDTSFALGQLAQTGEIRFERSGRTVVLEVPPHPLGDSR